MACSLADWGLNICLHQYLIASSILYTASYTDGGNGLGTKADGLGTRLYSMEVISDNYIIV